MMTRIVALFLFLSPRSRVTPTTRSSLVAAAPGLWRYFRPPGGIV